jgi:hypothetical protein
MPGRVAPGEEEEGIGNGVTGCLWCCLADIGYNNEACYSA